MNRTRVLACVVALLAICLVIGMGVVGYIEYELHGTQHTLGHDQRMLLIDDRKIAKLQLSATHATGERKKLRRLVRGLQDQVRGLGLVPFALSARQPSVAPSVRDGDESPAPATTTSPAPRKTRGSNTPPRTPPRSPSPPSRPTPTPTKSASIVCRVTGICPQLPKGARG